MANKNPDTSGLIPFTSETARQAQAKRHGGVRFHKYLVNLRPDQLRWLRAQPETTQSLIRDAIDLLIERRNG